MIRYLLALFIPFRWLIEKMGADYTQFIRILRLKLTIDDRRVNKFTRGRQNEQMKSLIRQSFFQVLIGGLFGMFLVLVKLPFTFYYIAHTTVMIMMAMMIISEFTTILFDTSENAIIQPLPVKGNTISLARNAHVFVYLTLMAFSISAVTLIIAFIKFGLVSGVVFILTIFLNVLFTLFFANILYLLIMRLATGERLKNLLMYFQIVIAIIFMAAYQFGLKMVDKTSIMNMVLPVHWYTYLFPPAFFSGFIEGVTTFSFDEVHLLFIAEAIIVPPFAIFFTGKYLTPIFNRKLLELEQGDRVSKIKTESVRQTLWFRLLSALYVTGHEERAAFKLMWKMTGRERQFKQTLLPAVGYIVIMIIAPFMGRNKSITELTTGDHFLFILYIFMFVSVGLGTSLLTGNNQPAAWMFKTVPLASPADFFKGCIKAAFARFFIPVYLIIATIVGYIRGIGIIADVFIALQSIFLLCSLSYYYQQPGFPFTMDKLASQGGKNAYKLFIIMLLTFIVGYLHYFTLHWFRFANLILIPVYGLSILYVNRVLVYRIITWKEVDRVNNLC